MTAQQSREELEKQFFSGKIPFALDSNSYKRFSERNMIFARVGWDETYSAYRRSIAEKESMKVGTPGYSRVGYAARSAAWTIYDNFRGAFAWDRIRAQDASYTDLTTGLPKYEPKNLEESAKAVKQVAQIFGAADVGI